MQIKLKYGTGNETFLSADVRNTVKGIELSNVENKGFYSSPMDINDSLLRQFKDPYCKIDTNTVKGKKELKNELLQKIEELKLEVLKMELAVKMCTRKTVYIAPKKK
jgi:hypothetical protein